MTSREGPGSNSPRQSEAQVAAEKARLAQIVRQVTGQNFYERLEVSKNATGEEIKKSLRKKTTSFHPDNKPEALRTLYGQIFSLYTEASNTLTNPNQRRRYESKIDYGRQQSAEAPSSPHKSHSSSYSPPPRPQPKVETKKETNKEPLIEQKKKARELIIMNLNFGTTLFEIERDKWVKAGVFTKHEVNKWEEVRRAGFNYIKANCTLGATLFKTTRDQWVKIGVFTEKEVNGWKEIRAKGFNYIKANCTLGANVFAGARDQWVETGVFTKEEVNRWEVVRDIAINAIRVYLNFGKTLFEKESGKWVKAGVITQAEADQIFRASGKK